jgi:hypothetical protein
MPEPEEAKNSRIGITRMLDLLVIDRIGASGISGSVALDAEERRRVYAALRTEFDESRLARLEKVEEAARGLWSFVDTEINAMNIAPSFDMNEKMDALRSALSASE